MDLSAKDRKRLSDLFARLAETGPEADTAARKIGDIAKRLGISGGDLRAVFLRGFEVHENYYTENTQEDEASSASNPSRELASITKFFAFCVFALIAFRYFFGSDISLIWNIVYSTMYVAIGFAIGGATLFLLYVKA